MTIWRQTLTTLLTLLLLTSSPGALAEDRLLGSWQGSFQVGQYDPLSLVLHITEQDGALQARLDIPSQFMQGIPVAAISLRNNQLLLRIPEIQAEFYGALQFGRDQSTVRSIFGDWSQSGEYVPMRLQRLDAATDTTR